MNPYNDELMAYEDDAEDRYDDYDGYEEDDFDTGFEGNEDSYYDEDEYYDEYTFDKDNSQKEELLKRYKL